jgi:hypothetical protein
MGGKVLNIGAGADYIRPQNFEIIGLFNKSNKTKNSNYGKLLK